MPKTYLMHNIGHAQRLGDLERQGAQPHAGRMASTAALPCSDACTLTCGDMHASWRSRRAARRRQATTLATRCCIYIAGNTLAMVSPLTGPGSSGQLPAYVARAAHRTAACARGFLRMPYRTCSKEGSVGDLLWRGHDARANEASRADK